MIGMRIGLIITVSPQFQPTIFRGWGQDYLPLASTNKLLRIDVINCRSLPRQRRISRPGNPWV